MNACFVKAIYDFVTREQEELPLAVGDVIEVLQEIDENWLRGRKSANMIGNFPRNFVEPVQIPTLEEGQRVFVGKLSFNGEVAGDLHFQKGTGYHEFHAIGLYYFIH